MQFLFNKQLALDKIKTYTNVLKKSNIDNMFNYTNYWVVRTSISPINMVQGYFSRAVVPYNKAKYLEKYRIYLQVSNKELQNPDKLNDIQSILYCFMIHSQQYAYYNSSSFVVNEEYKPPDYVWVMNWYHIQNYNVFYYDRLNLFEKYINNQKDFINKIKNYDTEQITAKDLDDYEKYIHLHKKYPDQFLVPTLNIDIVWRRAHMLDYNMYCSDSAEILGRILDHNDDVDEEKLDVGFNKTHIIGKKNMDIHLSKIT